MSAFTLRWCKEHGYWEDDVDSPTEACPTCIESGAFKTRAQLERELAKALKYEQDNARERSLFLQRAERAEAIAKGWAEAADRARQPDVFYKDYNEGTMRAMQALLSKASVKLSECMAHADAMHDVLAISTGGESRTAEAYRAWRAK